MSSDIYSKPDLSHKVRYTRRAEEDVAEWTDTCIYESGDDIDYAVSQLQEEGQQSQNQPVVKKRAVRGATLCKGVICIVVLAGLIILCSYLIVEFMEFKEFKELNYSHKLQEILDEVKQLKNRSEVTNMQLQSNYETLSTNYGLLKNDMKQLKDKVEGKWCPDRWTRFGSSCYFRSTETKSWYDSRKDCQGKGADLVIIDSEEKQKFVAHLSGNVESWIGLEGIQVTSGRTYVWSWTWVNGSSLKTNYWATEFPSVYDWNMYYATCCSPQGQWKHSVYNDYKNWICEK